MSTGYQRLPEHTAVGVDGSANSRAAVRWAVDHACEGDTITLVHAWQSSQTMVDAGLIGADDDTGARALLNREKVKAQQLPSRPGVTIEANLLRGDARSCLAGLDCDQLVVGARGHGGISGMLLGSVSAYLARHLHCPVMIVPHHVSPADS